MAKTKTVLIVDDDELTRLAYKDIVTAEGCQVLTASDGADGLKQALEHQPDLVMLDMMMPELDGAGFLKSFDPRKHPETKVIVLTNSASAEHLEEAKQLGAVRTLIKTDVKPQGIRAAVKELLGL